MIVERRRKMVDEGDLTSTQISTSHPGGADLGMLERHLEALREDRFTPCALAFYGRHIERTDEEHQVAWIEAVLRYTDRGDVSLLKDIRVRPSMQEAKDGLLLQVFERQVKSLNTPAEDDDTLVPPMPYGKKQMLPVHEGYVRGFRKHVERDVFNDLFGILIQKFLDHREMRALIEPRLSEHQRKILNSLSKLDIA